jgi:hypothetical protein
VAAALSGFPVEDGDVVENEEPRVSERHRSLLALLSDAKDSTEGDLTLTLVGYLRNDTEFGNSKLEAE